VAAGRSGMRARRVARTSVMLGPLYSFKQQQEQERETGTREATLDKITRFSQVASPRLSSLPHTRVCSQSQQQCESTFSDSGLRVAPATTRPQQPRHRPHRIASLAPRPTRSSHHHPPAGRSTASRYLNQKGRGGIGQLKERRASWRRRPCRSARSHFDRERPESGGDSVLLRRQCYRTTDIALFLFLAPLRSPEIGPGPRPAPPS
jgi:hypothetical protein